jgi:hypothetical protein
VVALQGSPNSHSQLWDFLFFLAATEVPTEQGYKQPSGKPSASQTKEHG